MIGLVHAVARKASGAYSAHGTSTRAASAPRRVPVRLTFIVQLYVRQRCQQ